jgi:hypothetical protein
MELKTWSLGKKVYSGPSRHSAAVTEWQGGAYGPPKEKGTAPLGSLKIREVLGTEASSVLFRWQGEA